MVRVPLAVPQEAQGGTHPRMKLKVRITALLTSFASLLIFVVVLVIAGVFSVVNAQGRTSPFHSFKVDLLSNR